MIIDAALPPISLDKVGAIACAADELGFGALWSTETSHDPFLPGPLVAEHSSRLKFGTAVAIAFARSPASLAYTAWDLAAASKGRFILGLGTQVKAHVERRFGVPWPDSVVGKLRDQLAAIRAFWHTWQTGEPLNFRSEHYKLTLMTPFFNPGPIQHPDIPIYIAGVNTGLARLAGEAADGFLVHPFHTAEYLREVLHPAIEQGAQKSGRERSAVSLSASVFVITSPAEREFVRQQLSFYASTPSYRAVMTHHGWTEAAEQLSSLASRGMWGEMPALISDEMLEKCAVIADTAGLAGALEQRYAGLVERITIYIPYLPGDRDPFWRELLKLEKSDG